MEISLQRLLCIRTHTAPPEQTGMAYVGTGSENPPVASLCVLFKSERR